MESTERVGGTAGSTTTSRRAGVALVPAPPDTPWHPSHNQNKPATLGRGVTNTCGEQQLGRPSTSRQWIPVPLVTTLIVILLLPGTLGHPAGDRSGVWARWRIRERRELINDETVSMTRGSQGLGK